MRTEIPVTPSSEFRLRRAEAKRQRRSDRNRSLFPSSAFRLDYNDLSVRALYEIAKARGLKVTTKTRKPVLFEMLTSERKIND